MDRSRFFQEMVQCFRHHCNSEEDLTLLTYCIIGSHPSLWNPEEVVLDKTKKENFLQQLSQSELPEQRRILSAWMFSENEPHRRKLVLKFFHRHASLDFQKKIFYNRMDKPDTALIQEKIMACESPEDLKMLILHDISNLNALLNNPHVFKKGIDANRKIKEFLSLHHGYFSIYVDGGLRGAWKRLFQKALERFPDIAFSGIESINLSIDFLDPSSQSIFAALSGSQRPLCSLFPCLKSLCVQIYPDEENANEAIDLIAFQEISKLSQLEDLELQVDYLSKELLDSLSKITSLDELKLVFDAFDIDDFSDILALPTVKHLGLFINNSDDAGPEDEIDAERFLQCLQLFPNLSSLVLNNVETSGLYADSMIRNPHPKLEHLALEADSIADYNFLTKIESLKSLALQNDMSNNALFPIVSGIESLCFSVQSSSHENKKLLVSFPNLRNLKLCGATRVFDFLKKGSLPHLKVLDLTQFATYLFALEFDSSIRTLSNKLPETLSNLESLTTIVLSPEIDISDWPSALLEKVQFMQP